MTEEPRTILLIEDDDADAKLIHTMLRASPRYMFEVERAASLADGQERLSQRPFDAVLLDLRLPDAEGLTALLELLAHSPDVAVVVITEMRDENLGYEAVRRGAHEFLVKDELESNLLVRALGYAMERHAARIERRETSARLKFLMHNVPAVLWTTDENLRVTSSLGAALSGLDLKPDELLGATVYDYFGTDDPEFLPIALHHAALAGESVSGDMHWKGRCYISHLEPLKTDSGRIIGVIGVGLDVTHERHLLESLEAANKIQQHLLPDKAPACRGFDIAGRCYPAEKCSGDFFDFIPMRDGRLALVIADVAGHGFGPAILAATVRSYLRAAAVLGRDVHEMLTVANWLLTADVDRIHFVTCVCARIDPEKLQLVYSAAGHQSFLVRYSGRVKELSATCIPLGINEHEVIPLSPRVRLKAGDVLLFVTDGVWEPQNVRQEKFGMDRVVELIHHNRHRPAGEIIDVLYQEVRRYAGDQPLLDDFTAVIVKVPGEPALDDEESSSDMW